MILKSASLTVPKYFYRSGLLWHLWNN